MEIFQIKTFSWLRFTHGITTWPCLNELGPESCSSTMCGACEKGKAKTMLQMFGQPYNSNTLATLPPKPEAMLNRVSSSFIRSPRENQVDTQFLFSRTFLCAKTAAPCAGSTIGCTT